MIRHLFWLPLIGACLLAIFAVTSTAKAGVVVGGTRVVFNESSREQTVQITNQGTSPAMVQSWIDDGQADARPRHIQVPFVLTPPLTRLEPGQGQTLRIAYLPLPDKPLPTDRATVYYLNVLEIPPTSDEHKGKNTLQLAVRTRIKLFFRPKGVEGMPREAATKLVWRVDGGASGRYLTVENPTSYYVSINQAVVSDGAQTDTPTMVAPHESARMPLGAKAIEKLPNAGMVAFQWIDDYGASVENITSLTSHDE
ncbi:MAG: putative fimbrial chaperone YadV [Luteibacter sp.]|uniref:fimbrial biogenesis chaperone n=1 Tax=Luteibacter sp. TaxID=1886636 RepID=UPI00137F25FA|nr:molecular chaperone [Luteibacter sp.]KAF1008053.1 MAG: putative fimbrial chaperone YadV [Luteibacter sp.]